MLLEQPGDESMWLAWVTKVPSKIQRYMYCMHICIFDMPTLRCVVLATEKLTLSSFERSVPCGVAGEL